MLDELKRRLARAMPRALRIEVGRLRRMPSWLLERRSMARTRLPAAGQATFAHQLASHETPLERVPGQVPAPLQRGKEINVARAAGLLDGIVIRPGQIFSYHHAVGRPARLRGFHFGLELHDGQPSRGVGGGCCAVSNLLYLLALQAGLVIVERHRHALDLFPDHGRTVPFGCGATVFYNRADLRFTNPLPFAVLLGLEVTARTLRGCIRAPHDPGWRVELYEVGHRFYRVEAGGPWRRENHVRRRIRWADGTVLVDHEIAHNRARVAYQPEDPCGGR
jgi:vancomycin resistance protein VanW